ncbi:hypothetical protein JOE21_001270 [Desmospora profundinema]|uniref:Uncharacterized protein n=1 Tax=Desmospora profundinema TaxID=1571184 RepID=A0ABU1IM94_9BACL|nr:hypothetical protein [Desmospora profundinema]
MGSFYRVKVSSVKAVLFHDRLDVAACRAFQLVPLLPISIVFTWREAWFSGGVDSATHGAKTENQAKTDLSV